MRSPVTPGPAHGRGSRLRAPSPRPHRPQLRSSGNSPHGPNTGTQLPPPSGPRGRLTPTSAGSCAGREARRQLLQSAYDSARARPTAGNRPRPRCKRLGFWGRAGRPSACLPSALGLRPSEAARRRLGAAAASEGRLLAGASRPPSSRRAPRRRASRRPCCGSLLFSFCGGAGPERPGPAASLAPSPVLARRPPTPGPRRTSPGPGRPGGPPAGSVGRG